MGRRLQWVMLLCAAAFLLGAAPSLANSCSNLALASNGGVASASSVNSNGLYPVSGVNDGVAQTSGGLGFWSDDTSGVWPDWVQVAWADPVALNRIVLRVPVVSPSLPVGIRTLARTRVQYWDEASGAWVDVRGQAGQANPIVDWVAPLNAADGSERREFTFSEITTTKIRAVIEQGATDGASWMEEIEAYGSRVSTRPPARNLARVENGGVASASSTHASGLYPVTGVNNGAVDTGATKGYWNDGTVGTWPDWVQIAWPQPVTLNRLVARIPLAQPGFPVGEITLTTTRIQYWNDTDDTWVDVRGREGQDNPILDWTGPIGANGTETRQFDFPSLATTKVRVLVEQGSSDGWSWLDEFEAWGWSS